MQSIDDLQLAAEREVLRLEETAPAADSPELGTWARAYANACADLVELRAAADVAELMDQPGLIVSPEVFDPLQSPADPAQPIGDLLYSLASRAALRAAFPEGVTQ